MEIINKCFLCGSESQRKLFQCIDIKQTREIFNIVQCVDCGFKFTNPRPAFDEIGQYYGKTYYSYQAPSTNLLANVPSNGKRFLEMGCGSGEYLIAMHNQGYDTYGIELDENVVSAAMKIGLDVRKAESNRLPFDPEYFDEIRLNHVLEHLHSLNDIVAEMGRCLKSDGVLKIEVPNISSFDSKNFGKYWRHLDVPRHLYHFDELSLRALLEKHGFCDIKISTVDVPVFKKLFYLKGLFTSAKSMFYTEEKRSLLSRIFHALFLTSVGFVRYALHNKSELDGAFLFASAKNR